MINGIRLKPRYIDHVPISLRSGRFRGRRSWWRNDDRPLCSGGARQSNSAMAYDPVVGPVTGEFLSASFGWRWVFWMLAMTITSFFCSKVLVVSALRPDQPGQRCHGRLSLFHHILETTQQQSYNARRSASGIS